MKQAGQTIDFKKLEVLIKDVNKTKSSKLGDLEYTIQNAKRSITYNKKQVEVYQAQLKKAKAALKKIDRTSLWNKENLQKALEEIKKHKQINWAFITKDHRLIVETHPLTQFDPFTQKHTGEPVGRFAFEILLNGYKSVRVAPMDFLSQSYRHPNCMSYIGEPCWNIGTSVRSLLDQGEYFAAIDYIITFFSTYPQSAGHRPLYWYVWLNERQNHFMQNPWFKEFQTSLYTIGEPIAAVAKEYEITRKEKITINNEEYVLKGLNFRNY